MDLPNTDLQKHISVIIQKYLLSIFMYHALKDNQ